MFIMLTKKCIQLYRLGLNNDVFEKLNNRHSDCKNVKLFAKCVRTLTTVVLFFGTPRYAHVAHMFAMHYVEKNRWKRDSYKMQCESRPNT